MCFGARLKSKFSRALFPFSWKLVLHKLGLNIKWELEWGRECFIDFLPRAPVTKREFSSLTHTHTYTHIHYLYLSFSLILFLSSCPYERYTIIYSHHRDIVTGCNHPWMNKKKTHFPYLWPFLFSQYTPFIFFHSFPFFRLLFLHLRLRHFFFICLFINLLFFPNLYPLFLLFFV